MWTEDDIVTAITDHPVEAIDAFGGVMLHSTGKRLNPEALTVVARMRAPHDPPGAYWVKVLKERGELDIFARALAARGVLASVDPVAGPSEPKAAPPGGAAALPAGVIAAMAITASAAASAPAPAAAPPAGPGGLNISPEEAKFMARADNFRCRIRCGNAFLGSGILIGPTTVLTAWHVISEAGPDQLEQIVPWWKRPIKVELPGVGDPIDVAMPPTDFSTCAANEWQTDIPADDSFAEKASDYAVLRLARPAGAAMGAARLPLPEQLPEFDQGRRLILVHFPADEDKLGIGWMKRFTGLSMRWGHSIPTKGGSSGGGCFDGDFRLAGIHQGRASNDPDDGGRMVPITRFIDRVRPIVAADQAPTRMWSLDGTIAGEFVIGRQSFFECFNQARGNGPVRGIHIRRADAGGDLGGLAFSYKLLDRMVARSPDTRVCRLSFETIVPDLADEIVRRAAGSGFEVWPEPPADPADPRPADAIAAERARNAANALDAAAAKRDVELWFFVDHPPIVFDNAMRAALAAFVDQLLTCANLRIVIAGFEPMKFGLEFSSPPDQTAMATPGLMNDVISDFGANDVREFLYDAATAAGYALDVGEARKIVERRLRGFDNVNGHYPPWLAGDVAQKLHEDVENFFAEAGAAGQ